ncbi:MAG: alpha-mannosidase [Clostridia bacterium]|nr:alpha-mannosidase [Clostridia bacterium]
MKKYYLIGNAHLDPVWMWNWQEGCSEAKATVRSALDRMKEYPDFVFTCAAAVLYKWIEEITPDMFEEVKARIKEGRWRLAGGWWVQPDCNLPSGESFVRHALYSQRYFHEKFGAVSKIGYNVDSFGHNNNLPQILKKSGMDAYVFMRPMKHEKEMPSNTFVWKSPDGTAIPAFRISRAYCNNFGAVEEIEKWCSMLDSESNPDLPECMLFYGVGNHGGGPTKRNIELFMERAKQDKENQYIFASPDDFFRDIADRIDMLPVHDDDLQHHASGCYAAYSTIKTLLRRSENRLLEAEALSTLAAAKLDSPYPAAKLQAGWEKTLFIHFHDALGGCSIEPVYTDMNEWAGESLAISGDLANLARQRIGWNIDTNTTPEGSYPFVVFNPHAWDVEATLRVNQQSSDVRTADGEELPFQNIKSYTSVCYGRNDTLVHVKVPAMGWKLCYLTTGSGERSYQGGVGVDENNFTLENEYLRVTFERHTGYVTSIYDKLHDRETIKGAACVPVVADEYYHDTWSHGRNYFNNFMARFSDAEIKVIERGPLRAVVRVTSTYNKSTIQQYFTLEAGSDKLEVRVNLDWQEQYKALKLEVPVNLADNLSAVYETPYAMITRPCDGEEEPAQKWVALTGTENGTARSFGWLNDCKYSFSMENNVIRMMAARGCIFGDHGNTRSDEDHFTDRGEQTFTYVLCPTGEALDPTALARAAMELNTPTSYIFESRHDGKLSVTFGGITNSSEHINVSIIKPAEDGDGYILRAYEVNGQAGDAEIALPMLGEGYRYQLHFEPYEIRTLRVKDGCAKEILMTELEA